eukprot:CAMPEP_0173415290 /NCGR_PEP_ID=MMETSP1356-20130122/84780_1 /TAXON_ID=77927 ORGANISM="Hemiselmis virescens, Strain PCC157" /NCGR_SAMPLE_ID=MMETSP1356 /ASSEMBLY_ACC=CAM_ASM_000847 /LENGTH=201 /DNA_ID=CAMNT_0014377527 /DNA_START=423 /DNA_END=1028 /DNA_ORIENTATION=-
MLIKIRTARVRRLTSRTCARRRDRAFRDGVHTRAGGGGGEWGRSSALSGPSRVPSWLESAMEEAIALGMQVIKMQCKGARLALPAGRCAGGPSRVARQRCCGPLALAEFFVHLALRGGSSLEDDDLPLPLSLCSPAGLLPVPVSCRCPSLLVVVVVALRLPSPSSLPRLSPTLFCLPPSLFLVRLLWGVCCPFFCVLCGDH